MFNFLSKKNNQNQEPFPNFSKEELDLELPNSLIAKAERVGECCDNGIEFAYRHVDYVFFDNQEPTTATLLTSRTGKKFDAPVKLSKNSDCKNLQEYTFVSEGKLYYIADNKDSRDSNTSTTTLRDLLVSCIMENEKNKCDVLNTIKRRKSTQETTTQPTLGE